MKPFKTLGLLAVAAMALMAFAATASADTLTSPTGTTFTGTIKAEAEGHVIYDNPAGKIECASTFESNVAEHGAGKTVKGNVTSLTFTNCTNGWHYTVVAGGSLSVHGVTGTYNGDVFSSGTTLEGTNPNLGNITCRYATNNTTLGTLTGGSTPTMHISGKIPFHSGSIFCGSGTTELTGRYTFKSPSSLYVDTN